MLPGTDHPLNVRGRRQDLGAQRAVGPLLLVHQGEVERRDREGKPVRAGLHDGRAQRPRNPDGAGEHIRVPDDVADVPAPVPPVLDGGVEYLEQLVAAPRPRPDDLFLQPVRVGGHAGVRGLGEPVEIR